MVDGGSTEVLTKASSAKGQRMLGIMRVVRVEGQMMKGTVCLGKHIETGPGRL